MMNITIAMTRKSNTVCGNAPYLSYRRPFRVGAEGDRQIAESDPANRQTQRRHDHILVFSQAISDD
jgi:hypothetical protein